MFHLQGKWRSCWHRLIYYFQYFLKVKFLFYLIGENNIFALPKEKKEKDLTNYLEEKEKNCYNIPGIKSMKIGEKHFLIHKHNGDILVMG